MTRDNMIADLLACRVTIDPWRAFVGLVELRQSEYVTRGEAFTIAPGYLGTDPAVLIHPDDRPALAECLRAWIRTDPTDLELASWVYWTERNRRRNGGS